MTGNMQLYNDFFTIIEQKENDFLIKFNKNHFIYRAHFPKNPITPGVLLMQIAAELLEIITNSKLFLRKIRNLKFLAVINPKIVENVHFTFSKIEKIESGYNISVEIHNGSTIFAKMSANFHKNE
ncbi:MAG: beta-hydroxyacyl-ACP dehydratase [Prevotellaceae bacterium]|jgi:3-hydroxyacyl-[acyl-carrier-protein] dehydratase|nr:beta-hydroxyacyl-ACP dehydratase [Prevotellaceae bacterium]